MKAVCLGLKPGAAGWKSQPNPLNYGGTPHFCFLPNPLRNLLFKSDVVVCMTVNKHNLLDETFFPTKKLFKSTKWHSQVKIYLYQNVFRAKNRLWNRFATFDHFLQKKKNFGTKNPFQNVLTKGSFTLAVFDAAVCGRWLSWHREIEKFLPLHSCSLLQNPQTTAASVNDSLQQVNNV